ncbi:MAG: LacI family DNA-binding transcriptional regulator [Mangrovicoccus sp.]|nr:LacI family DNA-binding transcriptional regulator [Mangrovicoccus sp.]
MSGPITSRKVTVTDVARRAKVSPGTVSNALSGKRHVNAETRQRIEQAIEELGYVPNLTARQMRTGRSNTIAIASSMSVGVAAGPSKLGFLMEIAAAAAITALERNTALILIPPIDNPQSALDQLSVDGALIVEPERDDPMLETLIRRRVPTICIGAPPEMTLPHVALEYSAMANLLIDHLLDCGSRHFPLILGQSDRQTNRDFRAVYLARAKAEGRPAHIIELPEQNAEAAAETALRQQMEQGLSFDGILVPVDAMATGVMRALRGAGLNIPGDVRVVTRYDGLRARQETPALTAIDLQLDEVARIATEALAQMIEQVAIPPIIKAPTPRLLARRSSLLS